MTDQPEPTPDFTSPLSGIEVRDPCPHCGDRQLIPRIQMAEHLARLHPEVRRTYASGGELDASFTPDPPSECAITHAITPTPAPEPGLREQYAAAIEYALLPVMPRQDHRQHAANQATDAVLSVRDAEMEQLREMYGQQSQANAAYRLQIDDLIRRNSEYADRAITNGKRADRPVALLGEAVDWIHEGELRDRIVAALNPAHESTPPAAHRGGNAEDCPACAGTNPPYPFICPGPEPTALDQPQER